VHPVRVRFECGGSGEATRLRLLWRGQMTFKLTRYKPPVIPIPVLEARRYRIAALLAIWLRIGAVLE
jgi:hypothetical protein